MKKQEARDTLKALNEQQQVVRCGDCGAHHIARWVYVEFEGSDWTAFSEVECSCGSTLSSTWFGQRVRVQ